MIFIIGIKINEWVISRYKKKTTYNTLFFITLFMNKAAFAGPPFWLKKSWGEWTSYGGVGYAVNSAIYMNVAMRNYPYAGWLLQRNINEHLILGVEIFSQGAVSIPTRSFTIINAGGYYKFTKNFSLLFSAGHSVAGEQHIAGYLGLYWTGGN